MKRTSDYLNEIAKEDDTFYELTSEEQIILKQTLLEIFDDVTQVCKKYNLSLMLGGGSVLGAIRHQGFIPWDDDLDTLLSRKDYDKFISVFPKELGDKYILSVPRTGKDSKTLFAQIIKKNTVMRCQLDHFHNEANGIRIDLYPIDSAPSSKILQNLMAGFANGLRIIALSVTMYQSDSSFYKKYFLSSMSARLHYYTRYVIGMIFSVFSRQRLYNFFDWLMSRNYGSKYSTIPTGRKLYKGETHRSEIFFPVKVASFEGREVYVPADSHAYLKGLYGDYMQIPPVEKRERHFYMEVNFNTTAN